MMVFTLPRCGCTSSMTLFIGWSDAYPLQKAIAVWMLITYRPNSVTMLLPWCAADRRVTPGNYCTDITEKLSQTNQRMNEQL